MSHHLGHGHQHPDRPGNPNRKRNAALTIGGVVAAVAAAVGVATHRPGPSPAPPTPPASGNVQRLVSGATPITLRNKSNLILDGGPEVATLRGNGSGQQDGILLLGCRNITVRNVELLNWYRGFRAADSAGIVLENVKARANRQQGIFTVNCSDIRLKGCVGDGTREQHGCYLSGTTRNALVEDCTFTNNGRTGFQCNSESGGPALNVVLRRVKCSGNQKAQGGGGQINLLGVGTAGSPFLLEDCSAPGGRGTVATNFAAGRPCFGTIRRHAGPVVIENSPGVKWLH